MTYLLDTNVCIRLLNSSSDTPLARRVERLTPENFRLCSVVKFELYYGACKSAKPEQNLAKLSSFFRQFKSLPFDDDASFIAGQIRAQLTAMGTPIGPNDLLIAAIALANNLTLITHNIREFSRVENLQYEDWE